MDSTRCQATTKSGQPCSAKARPGRTFCPWHDPLAEHERRAWSAKGGASRSNLMRARKKIHGEIANLGDLQSVLTKALLDVRDGTLDPSVANAMAALARTIMQLQLGVELEVEVEHLQRRVGALSARFEGA